MEVLPYTPRARSKSHISRAATVHTYTQWKSNQELDVDTLHFDCAFRCEFWPDTWKRKENCI